MATSMLNCPTTPTPPPYSLSIEKLSLKGNQDGLVPLDWLSPSPEPTGLSSKPLDISVDVRRRIYQPLNANPQQLEIRLLTISPYNNKQGDMCCTLQQMPLESAPEYYALSYHWGDSDDQSPRPIILVNDYDFPIQPNLWDAMQALRSRGHLTIWADAICLDQSNDQEKAQQVPRMKLIYQRAKGVAIWVGKEENNSNEVMTILKNMASTDWTKENEKRFARLLPILEDENRTLAPNSQRIEYFSAYFLGIIAGRLNLGIESLEQLPTVMNDEVLASVKDEGATLQQKLDAFFARPYWRRMWIIQEVAAARSAAVFCGDQCVLWDNLTAVVRALDDGKTDWKDMTDVSAWNIDVIRKLRYKVQNRIPIGLLTAMQRSYAFEAGRVQDNVYALMGLSWDTDRYIHTVSYAKEWTANRIMFEMTKQWLKGGFLDIICLQPAVENDNSLPSWLPKWFSAGRSHATDRLVDFLESRRPLAILSKYGHSWKATQRSKSAFHQFLDHGRVLLVRGAHVDTIDGLSRACEADKDDPSLQSSWNSRVPPPPTVPEMKQIRNHLYWTLNMYKQEAANGIPDQTLNLDILWSEDIKKTFAKEEWTAMTDWLDALSQFRIYGRPFEQWLQHRPKYRNIAKLVVLNKLIKEPDERTYRNEHEESIVTAFRDVFADGRRLMTTRRGRVGWAHPSARPGDRIYLLEGCNLPVILAPCNEMFDEYHTCVLVGDAYVHGIMYGELWEDASQRLEDLFLR